MKYKSSRFSSYESIQEINWFQSAKKNLYQISIQNGSTRECLEWFHLSLLQGLKEYHKVDVQPNHSHTNHLNQVFEKIVELVQEWAQLLVVNRINTTDLHLDAVVSQLLAFLMSEQIIALRLKRHENEMKYSQLLINLAFIASKYGQIDRGMQLCSALLSNLCHYATRKDVHIENEKFIFQYYLAHFHVMMGNEKEKALFQSSKIPCLDMTMSDGGHPHYSEAIRILKEILTGLKNVPGRIQLDSHTNDVSWSIPMERSLPLFSIHDQGHIHPHIKVIHLLYD